MEVFLWPAGLWAPLLFTALQAIQVVIPILPGGIGCLGGVLMFGPVMGFLYNYVGICLGSVAAFLLSKRYGQPFVRSVAGERTYEKYAGWLEKGNRFDTFFALAIFFPVAPDDFLCYLAGLTRMSLKKFSAIIFLGKPASIALYSLGLHSIMALLAARVFNIYRRDGADMKLLLYTGGRSLVEKSGIGRAIAIRSRHLRQAAWIIRKMRRMHTRKFI